MCKWMIEWLCLTGDWYRKGMSMLDSNPSMSLYLRCKVLENNFIERNSRPLWTFHKHLGSNNIENCNSFTTWLFDWYVIISFHRDDFSWQPKKANIERESDNNEDSKTDFIPAKLKCRRWFIRVFRFLFSSMTFSCFFFDFKLETYGKRVDLTLKHFNLSLDL